ncbi:ATP-binding protein [Candidatus Micrarchaeota archaeon]|nr:ATP-binding protein [Candidatus Micrarchaeota archaeon]
MNWEEYESTKDIPIPKDPFEQVIGQDEAVAIAKIIPKQKRHLLLVGPPGTGKSMIARAVSSVLPKPEYEISVLHNSKLPERPRMELRTREQIKKENPERVPVYGKETDPSSVPTFVTEKLGFRCRRCGELSMPSLVFCPSCGAEKFFTRSGPFEDLLYNVKNEKRNAVRLQTKKVSEDGKEQIVFYEKTIDDKLIMLTPNDIKKMEKNIKKSKRKIIVPVSRSLFVQATGASETELLGDVKHDPYGDHPEIGTPAFMRVVAGAVHEAHEGILFIDELSTLGKLQRYLLTAMQDKTFPISGRNPTSAGASVKVSDVPCNFIFVGATNISDLQHLIPPLRSRIRGEGYEVLVNSHMVDTDENRTKLAQFISQEIIKDGKIPHMNAVAVKLVIHESRDMARKIDNAEGLSLRLRRLSGIIKLSGDLASVDGSDFIEKKHFERALKNARPIEEQIAEKYDSWWKAGMADSGLNAGKSGSETV